MHEMGIAMELADIAIQSIPSALEGSRVRQIHLAVGQLTAVIPDTLRFCFDMVAKNTPLEGAELMIETLPVKARCSACNTCTTLLEPIFVCPACHSGDMEILSGRELDIISISIDEEASPCG